MLADLSPMLSSLITGLIRSPQIDVIDGTNTGDVGSLIAETGATVVIMPGEGGGMSEAGRRLLADRASLRVLALRDHAASGVVGALTVQTVGLDTISKATLLQAVAGDLGLDDDAAAPAPTKPGGAA